MWFGVVKLEVGVNRGPVSCSAPRKMLKKTFPYWCCPWQPWFHVLEITEVLIASSQPAANGRVVMSHLNLHRFYQGRETLLTEALVRKEKKI